MNKTIKVWIAINKNGKLTLHGEYPVRDEKMVNGHQNIHL